ncbi:MAG: hypothetical protein J6A52_02365 [Bacilli bacterium]|nr:hypothetical protein [Bacilli bacterium]
MNLSVATIIMFTTLVLGTICRTFNICSEANIPLQNLIIGVISGFLCFFTGIENNLLSAIIFCVISSFSAGGVYDLSKMVRRTRK